MGEQLLKNGSYGNQEVSILLSKIKCQWEDFKTQLLRWSQLFQVSIEFRMKVDEVGQGPPGMCKGMYINV